MFWKLWVTAMSNQALDPMQINLSSTEEAISRLSDKDKTDILCFLQALVKAVNIKNEGRTDKRRNKR